MKVKISDTRCVGHGMCNLIAPQIFILSDEDGHAQVRTEDVPPEFEEVVDSAHRSCPEEAIIVSE